MENAVNTSFMTTQRVEPPQLSTREIDEIFRWARSRGHPAYLWPDTPISAWRAALEQIAAILPAGILEPGAPLRIDIPIGTERAFGLAAFTSGTGALLGRWIEDGRLHTAQPLSALLGLHLERARQRAQRMQFELRRVLDLLHENRLSTTVLKGSFTGSIYFPEPATRPAADIDLLVSRNRIEEIERILRDARYVPSVFQTRPYKCSWFPPGMGRDLQTLEIDHADNPFTLEIHTSLDRAFYGVRRLSFGTQATAYTQPWDFHPAARKLVTPLLPAFLAAHASEEIHQLQLVRILELGLVIRTELTTPEHWDHFLALLDDVGGRRFAYPALELAERLIPGLVPPAIRGALNEAAPARMRRVVRALTPATAQKLDRLSLDERFMWADGPVETLRRFANLLWPTRARRSHRTLFALYTERVYRLIRGTVSVRAGTGGDPSSAD